VSVPTTTVGHLVLPAPGESLATFVGGVRGALTTDDTAPTELQIGLLRALVVQFYGAGSATVLDDDTIVEPRDLAAAIGRSPELVELFLHVVVTAELLVHPLAPRAARRVQAYADALHVTAAPSLEVLRDEADGHLRRVYADIQRNSWYRAETFRQVLHGRLLELTRSKLAYYGLAHDEDIARRWESLGACAEGTWGRGVHDFYRVHGFAFPGQPHGIYEIGARHDWVHVLCDYGPTPEGEIDVFAFIAGTMHDPKGFMQFVFTLALFQNATVDRVGGLRVAIARADTLDEPGSVARLADALDRAAHCTTDVMGELDLWAHADEPLDEVRRRFGVPPKGVPGGGAWDR